MARMQIVRGAMGITCQKVGEAEAMAAGGIETDILIPFNIMGSEKLERLAALARRVPRLTVSADSEETVRGIAGAARGVTVGVLVEVETGLKRTGVPTPQKAVELARVIHELPGLELRGIMGFPTMPDTRPVIRETVSLFDRDGLPRPVVSGGCTPGALIAHETPELTEYRAGEYAVGGEGHLRSGRHTVAQCALRVLTTVVSRPVEDRAILDAGTKTLSASALRMDWGDSFGYVVEYPEARFHGASEEHGHVDIGPCARRPRIGERVQVLPVHPCPCVNEHDEIVAVRQGRVEAVWPVHARGKIR
jgi:D-serine deaminase-like pyridoxal phosphate-dependent protein